jgi:hypothetical protein
VSAAALTAAPAATGIGAWLVARRPAWLTPRRKRGVGIFLVSAGVLAAGVIGPSD